MRRLVPIVLVLLCLALAARSAEAQVVFPPDSAYAPMLCNRAPMTDPFDDTAGAFDDLDIVGDFGAPAGLRSADDEFLYVRLRFDTDPAPGGVPEAGAWGIEIDLDGDLTTYELALIVDGVSAGAPQVRVFENVAVTLPNDPADPADLPAVATFPFADNAQTSEDGFDFLLDFAVPWSTLIPLGLDRDTPVFIWAGSSLTANSLDADLACHDGASGAPLLVDIASDETVADPLLDSDGDGFTDAEEVEAGTDPNDPNSVPLSRLEGGGGCDAGGGAGLGVTLALALALLGARLLRKRRRVDLGDAFGRTMVGDDATTTGI